jgi:hypothetical protein
VFVKLLIRGAPMKKPPKWSQIYPQGTTKGDEEQKFFKVLSRGKYDFLSIAQIAQESGLSKERVEEIIEKYHCICVVLQNPENEDQWGYWERCEELLPEDRPSVSQSDKQFRIKKARHC